MAKTFKPKILSSFSNPPSLLSNNQQQQNLLYNNPQLFKHNPQKSHNSNSFLNSSQEKTKNKSNKRLIRNFKEAAKEKEKSEDEISQQEEEEEEEEKQETISSFSFISKTKLKRTSPTQFKKLQVNTLLNETEEGGEEEEKKKKKRKVTPRRLGQHVCPVCNHVFGRNEHLRRHLVTHTGERPYACGYPNCEKTFSRKDNLYQHQKKHLREQGLNGYKNGEDEFDEAQEMEDDQVLPKGRERGEVTNKKQDKKNSYTVELINENRDNFYERGLEEEEEKEEEEEEEEESSEELDSDNFEIVEEGESSNFNFQRKEDNFIVNKNQNGTNNNSFYKLPEVKETYKPMKSYIFENGNGNEREMTNSGNKAIETSTTSTTTTTTTTTTMDGKEDMSFYFYSFDKGSRGIKRHALKKTKKQPMEMVFDSKQNFEVVPDIPLHFDTNSFSKSSATFNSTSTTTSQFPSSTNSLSCNIFNDYSFFQVNYDQLSSQAKGSSSSNPTKLNYSNSFSKVFNAPAPLKIHPVATPKSYSSPYQNSTRQSESKSKKLKKPPNQPQTQPKNLGIELTDQRSSSQGTFNTSVSKSKNKTIEGPQLPGINQLISQPYTSNFLPTSTSTSTSTSSTTSLTSNTIPSLNGFPSDSSFLSKFKI